MQHATVAGMCSTFLTILSLEKELVLKEKHTKGKKKLIVKQHKKVCFVSVNSFLDACHIHLLQQIWRLDA